MIHLLLAILLVFGGISPATVGEFEQWSAQEKAAWLAIFSPDGHTQLVEGRALDAVPEGAVVSRNTTPNECYAPDLAEVIQVDTLKISQWRTTSIRYRRIYVTALSLDRPLSLDDLALIRLTYQHKLKWLGRSSACRAWEVTWLSLRRKIGVQYRTALWVAVRS